MQEYIVVGNYFNLFCILYSFLYLRDAWYILTSLMHRRRSRERKANSLVNQKEENANEEGCVNALSMTHEAGRGG